MTALSAADNPSSAPNHALMREPGPQYRTASAWRRLAYGAKLFVDVFDPNRKVGVMLSYNAQQEARLARSTCPRACGGDLATKAARRAHTAHALVLGFHTLCCGLPLLAALLASGALGLASIALIAGAVDAVHAVLHRHEIWILAVSAGLVAVGGLAEWAARRRGLARGFPAFFVISVVCLALNAGIVASHRLPLAQATSVSAHAEPDHTH